MLSIQGQIDIACTQERAWDLLNRFDEVARLIPSVESVEIDGDHVHGRVAVQLGRLRVSSRVTLEVTERKTLCCLKAEGISFLGETIQKQIAKNGVRGITSGSVGKLRLHLDLRPGDGADCTVLIYEAEVDAAGRLKRIYQSILKNKAPEMIAQFAINIREVLERDQTAVELVSSTGGGATTTRQSWWKRLGAWFRRVFARKKES